MNDTEATAVSPTATHDAMVSARKIDARELLGRIQRHTRSLRRDAVMRAIQRALANGEAPISSMPNATWLARNDDWNGEGPTPV